MFGEFVPWGINVQGKEKQIQEGDNTIPGRGSCAALIGSAVNSNGAADTINTVHSRILS